MPPAIKPDDVVEYLDHDLGCHMPGRVVVREGGEEQGRSGEISISMPASFSRIALSAAMVLRSDGRSVTSRLICFWADAM